MIKICKYCGEEFKVTESRVKTGRGIYCSKKCFLTATLQKPAIERFWACVEKTDGCWIWAGTLVRQGYGQIDIGGRKKTGAHRFSYELHKGKIENGLFVLHKCDKPACVNPDHLFLGTNQDNMDDMCNKGRQAAFHGEKNPSSKITEKEVLEIRKLSGTMKLSEISKMFNLSLQHVYAILTNRIWKHIQAETTHSEHIIFNDEHDTDWKNS